MSVLAPSKLVRMTITPDSQAVKEIPKELAQLNEKLRLLIEILESGRRGMNDDRLGGLSRFV
jgi:hypothetical protein